jgi:SUKH superfamily protein
MSMTNLEQALQLIQVNEGCGNVAGAEFYGLIDDTFVNSSIPNGIWLTLDERRTSKLPHALILVSETGNGGYYATDTSRRDSQGENPVMVWFPGLSKVGREVEEVAEDFGTFVFQRLRQALQ